MNRKDKTDKTGKGAANGMRFVCDNWDRPTVKVKSHGRGAMPARKVVTRGTKTIECGGILESAAKMLREGYEVRLARKGETAVRLIPMIDAKTNGMYVDARTLVGAFRDGTLADKTARFVRFGREVSAEAVGEFVDRKKSEKRGGEDEVTPDTLVTCPKCGYRFRVGRRMAA